jgi:hypothetical protein
VSIFRSVAKVNAAAMHARLARHAVGGPASALLERGREYPLTMVGAAAGAGLVLGKLNVHPLRVPGLSALLSGGLAEAVSFGAKLIGELGLVGLGAAVRDAVADADDAQP